MAGFAELGRGSLTLMNAEAEGLMLPPKVPAPMAGAPYVDGISP